MGLTTRPASAGTDREPRSIDHLHPNRHRNPPRDRDDILFDFDLDDFVFDVPASSDTQRRLRPRKPYRTQRPDLRSNVFGFSAVDVSSVFPSTRSGADFATVSPISSVSGGGTDLPVGSGSR